MISLFFCMAQQEVARVGVVSPVDEVATIVIKFNVQPRVCDEQLAKSRANLARVEKLYGDPFFLQDNPPPYSKL